jgi:hypothetical protein
VTSGVARGVASAAANAGTPEQIPGTTRTGKDELVGSEWLGLSGEMAVGGGIEPPTCTDSFPPLTGASEVPGGRGWQPRGRRAGNLATKRRKTLASPAFLRRGRRVQMRPGFTSGGTPRARVRVHVAPRRHRSCRSQKTDPQRPRSARHVASFAFARRPFGDFGRPGRGRRYATGQPSSETGQAGRVLVRVLAVNPRPRTFIHENGWAKSEGGGKHGGERLEAPSNHLGWTARVDVDWRGRRDSNPRPSA